jgi:hypothetical protein
VVESPLAPVGAAGVGTARQPGRHVPIRVVILRQQDLRRAEPQQFLRNRPLDRFGVGAGELRGGELAGGDVGVGDTGARALDQHGGEVIVGVTGEHTRLDDGAGGDDARDAALDDLPPLRRLADLLADGDLVPGGDQLGDVGLGGVVRHPGQWQLLPPPHLARGEGDVEDARGDLGVVLEHLVEVAETEEEEDIGVLALDRQVLLPDRRRHRPSVQGEGVYVHINMADYRTAGCAVQAWRARL